MNPADLPPRQDHPGDADAHACPVHSSHDLWETAFDPPHLGIPANPTASARVVDHQGAFVEIFVSVAQGRIVDVGFLTSLPGPGMAAASLWCAAVTGKSLSEAVNIPPKPPPGLPAGHGLRRAARLAARAGNAALVRASRPKA
ncbi:hypothetical protein ASZ90_001106 [hydrocarbon metagenome]|uniref:Uncharacterized protein n=1 Tax=hydrocarbon metagenome TaxID=938273 RepID=A0A0W8G783_9ZZZZ